MEGACGKGEEAQVGWLDGMPVQHQVRENSHSEQEHVSGVLCIGVGRKPTTEEGQTCLVA